MVYKRYNSPFEEPIKKPEGAKGPQEHREKDSKPPCKKQNPKPLGFLDNLSYDDIIIAGLIIILLGESKEDRDVPLILTLAFLFLIQYIDAD